MFTGIVETTARILEKRSDGLTIERPAAFDDLRLGSSICVSGACLSIVGLEKGSMRFDVVPETWSRTVFGSLRAGDAVNLERSLKASDRFEGHIVQGHVEGVGKVTVMDRRKGDDAGEWWSSIEHAWLTIALPLHLLPATVPKGSIAVDGVSLTVAKIEQEMCSIALIPHTLQHTTLGSLRIGDSVHIETDVLLRWMAQATVPLR